MVETLEAQKSNIAKGKMSQPCSLFLALVPNFRENYPISFLTQYSFTRQNHMRKSQNYHSISIYMEFLENIDMDFLENIDIDIDKGILQNIGINQILHR